MSLDFQSQTILNHFKSLLNNINDVKQQSLILKEISNIIEGNIQKYRRELNRKRYLANKENREKIKPKIQMMAKLSLQAGDIVRIKGTRDSGIREIISFSDDKVICYKLISFSWRTGSMIKQIHNYDRCGKTKNDLSSIIYYLEKNNWIKISEKFIL